MNQRNDVEVRFEAVKIAGKQIQVARGIQPILFDAQQIYEYIKTGKMPALENKE